MIVNPGAGPVDGATLDDACKNVDAFMADLRAAGHGHEVRFGWYRGHEAAHDGRWSYVIEVNERPRTIDMPGLPLEQVRFMAEPDQNIWDFPRLYVDGSSWIWLFALHVCDPEEVE